jgi:hypothetical protein
MIGTRARASLAPDVSLRVFAMRCVSAENADPPIHGIVGFAWRAVSRAGAPTLLDTLFAQSEISQRVVSFHLTRQFNEAGSVVIIGTPDMQYAPKGKSHHHSNSAHSARDPTDLARCAAFLSSPFR